MGMSQGADDYLDKPFLLDLLKAKIEASSGVLISIKRWRAFI